MNISDIFFGAIIQGAGLTIGVFATVAIFQFIGAMLE